MLEMGAPARMVPIWRLEAAAAAAEWEVAVIVVERRRVERRRSLDIALVWWCGCV
jgi:hypothetical protein